MTDNPVARPAPRVVVYTCITNAKDTLKDEQEFRGVDYVAFVDQPLSSSTWQVRPVRDLFREARRNSRMYKALSHVLFPDADITVWIDGSITILRDLTPLLDDLMARCDIATFRHPERNCLYDEARVCQYYRLDNTHLIESQVEAYRRRQVPERLGLFETNVLIRRNTARVRAFNALWWGELSLHSLRDQISFPYAAREAGVTIGILPGNAQNLPHVSPRRSGSDYFLWHPHQK